MEDIRLWTCPGCQRVLRERSVDEAQRLHEQLVREQCGGSSADFVAEAMWPAYLASQRRCRCGSRKRLKPVSPATLRGQLALHLDAVVVQ
jgi:hypothetical protein